ncbi:MAG TPA: 30S ribosomal protein S16 [Candidatus Paceibacterota bacterium]|nr:30S ribosomal protein S16 [Candidatus Paceibacterota bacterium]
MLAIKLQRRGKKHQASFRLIVTEKRSKLGGRFIEDLGWLDPKAKKSEVKKDKIEHWLKVGAKPTPSVHNLLVREGVLKAPKIPVHKKSKKTVDKETSPTPVAASSTTVETVPASPQSEAK